MNRHSAWYDVKLYICVSESSVRTAQWSRIQRKQKLLYSDRGSQISLSQTSLPHCVILCTIVILLLNVIFSNVVLKLTDDIVLYFLMHFPFLMPYHHTFVGHIDLPLVGSLYQVLMPKNFRLKTLLGVENQLCRGIFVLRTHFLLSIFFFF